MIVKTTNEKPPVSGYEKYFLFEAPGDEAPKKKNVKVIKLRPYDKRRTDYTKMVPQIEDQPDENQGDTSDADVSNEPADDTSTDTDTSVDTTIDGTETEPTDDGGEDAVTDDTDYSTDDGDTSDADVSTEPSDDTSTDGTETEPTDDAVTDDTDYSADTDGIDDTDNSGDDNTQETNTDKRDDKSNKFVLFKKFITLEGAIANYIQKLSGTISDDVGCNHIYKKITNNLKELDDMMHEYMVIKFENSSYVESMLFYQRILASIGINFEMLKGIRDKEVKMNNKKTKH